MNELTCHLLGDYVLQTDHQAACKTQAHGPALAHAFTYTLPFTMLTRRWQPLAVIAGTHFIIDRWRLARYVVWAKNQAAPAAYRYPWSHGCGTGYHGPTDGVHISEEYARAAGLEADFCRVEEKPAWMAVWLMILCDNCLHGILNSWALRRWPTECPTLGGD